MKVLNFVSSALLSGVLSVSTAFGSNGHDVKSDIPSVREQLVSTLNVLTEEYKGEVNVYFSVSPSGVFELSKVTGADKNLVDRVKYRLTKGSIVVPEGFVGNYSVKVLIGEKNSVAKDVSPEELLRDAISGALAKLDVSNGSVTLFFSVNDNKLNVTKVEGSDKLLISNVENTLNNSSVSLPAEMTGKNYEVNVKF
jgi:hypothetical protein